MTPRVAAAPVSYGVFEITADRDDLPAGPVLVEAMASAGYAGTEHDRAAEIDGQRPDREPAPGARGDDAVDEEPQQRAESAEPRRADPRQRGHETVLTRRASDVPRCRHA